MYGRDLLTNNVGWAVGSGKMINISGERWLNIEQPRQPMEPATKDTCNLTVNDLLNPNSTPPKIRSFLWRALKNAISTRATLRERHVEIDESCIIYGERETPHHVLFTYPYDVEVWKYASLEKPTNLVGLMQLGANRCGEQCRGGFGRIWRGGELLEPLRQTNVENDVMSPLIAESLSLRSAINETIERENGEK